MLLPVQLNVPVPFAWHFSGPVLPWEAAWSGMDVPKDQGSTKALGRNLSSNKVVS